MAKLTCLQCGHEFHGNLYFDDLGWHSLCPECGGSFDTDAPVIDPVVLDAQRTRFRDQGKFWLDQAQDYLHRNCDDWNVNHENHYRDCIRKAELNCARFTVLNDILSDGKIIC
jgi:hypothetical protein